MHFIDLMGGLELDIPVASKLPSTEDPMEVDVAPSNSAPPSGDSDAPAEDHAPSNSVVDTAGWPPYGPPEAPAQDHDPSNSVVDAAGDGGGLHPPPP